MAVAGWLLGRWGVGGAAPGGRPVPATALGLPGSFAYRAGILGACGLSEVVLAALVTSHRDRRLADGGGCRRRKQVRFGPAGHDELE